MFHSRFKLQSIFVLADTVFFFLKQMTYLLDKKRDLTASWPKGELSKSRLHGERHRPAVSSYNLHCTIKDTTGHVCSLKHLS